MVTDADGWTDRPMLDWLLVTANINKVCQCYISTLSSFIIGEQTSITAVTHTAGFTVNTHTHTDYPEGLTDDYTIKRLLLNNNLYTFVYIFKYP